VSCGGYHGFYLVAMTKNEEMYHFYQTGAGTPIIPFCLIPRYPNPPFKDVDAFEKTQKGRN
jgi:hypothetical protein